MDARKVEIGRLVFAPAGNDYLRFCWLTEQGLNDGLNRKKLEIHCGVQLIEDHGFVEPTRDRSPGDFPGAFSFHVVDGLLLATPNDGITP